MAANLNSINVEDVDWDAMEATSGDSRRTGAVDKIAAIARLIMTKNPDKQYDVKKLSTVIQNGLNSQIENDEDKVEINWSTVHYALIHRAGFKQVEKNVFIYDAEAKPIVKAKRARK